MIASKMKLTNVALKRFSLHVLNIFFHENLSLSLSLSLSHTFGNQNEIPLVDKIALRDQNIQYISLKGCF